MLVLGMASEGGEGGMGAGGGVECGGGAAEFGR